MKWGLPLLILLFGLSPLRADDPLPYEATPDQIDLDGYIIFYNAEGPLSYASATPQDLPDNAVSIGRVHGKACQHGLALPFTVNVKGQSGKLSGAYGRGGYERALRKIKKDHSDIQGIYDVQVDLHQTSILTIYRRVCTEVTALAFK